MGRQLCASLSSLDKVNPPHDADRSFRLMFPWGRSNQPPNPNRMSFGVGNARQLLSDGPGMMLPETQSRSIRPGYVFPVRVSVHTALWQGEGLLSRLPRTDTANTTRPTAADTTSPVPAVIAEVATRMATIPPTAALASLATADAECQSKPFCAT